MMRAEVFRKRTPVFLGTQTGKYTRVDCFDTHADTFALASFLLISMQVN